jgi:NADH-quinone oxidoreductase subunit D
MSNTLTLNIGPQHPGAGHFRLIVEVDGDIIVNAKPDPGYVHRGAEKMAEHRNYFQNIPHLERPVIIDSTGITLPYCLAAEQLLGLEVPDRGKWIRMIMAELNRIISHLYWLGIYGPFLGHTTMFMWPMGDRELFIDLAQSIAGQRVTFAFSVPGGVRSDIPQGFEEKALKVFKHFEGRIAEYRRIFLDNPLVKKRTQGVGVLSRSQAIDLGLTGPNLRGSGAKSDTRIDEPYDNYDQVKFEVPVFDEGDCYSRTAVRFVELQESLNIMRQCLAKMKPGPVKAALRGRTNLSGEAFTRTEAARGAMSFYMIGDGTSLPYRCKISVPSFRMLAAMPVILKGVHIADMPAAYWSLDYWPVEADR